MNETTFLQSQVVQLRALLEGAEDDPVLVPQLQARLRDAEEELGALLASEGSLLPRHNPIPPRVAVFLRGGGVQNSEGIRPGLAGEALIQYEKMFTAQALHDERAAARAAGRQRRQRGSPNPTLLFTGTPRGSFGLEFVPQQMEDAATLDVHSKSLRKVADALMVIGCGSADTLDDDLKRIPPGVLRPLKQFLTVLADYGAELRMAFSDSPSQLLASEAIQRTADRLKSEISEEEIEIEGTFRGVTRETGFFDFLDTESNLINGIVSDDLTEDDLERIDELTNKPCIAKLYKTTVRQVSSPQPPTYILLDAQPES